MDPRDVLSRPAPEPDLTLRYGELPEHVADLYWPRSADGAGTTGRGGGDATAPADALVLLVHGGFWRAEFDRTHVRPLCVGLAGAGYTVASIEFRRTGQPGGGWPGTFDDVAAAVDTVPDLARVAAGTEGRTLTRVLLMGHSAGGHLAAWAASRPSLPLTSPWYRPDAGADAAVSLAGVVDLALAHRLGLDDDATGLLLGGGPDDVPDRYATTDPAALVPAVPVTQLHGTADDRVPIEVGRAYTSRGLAGVRLVELPGIEHFGLIDPLSPAWTTVLAAVRGDVRRG